MAHYGPPYPERRQDDEFRRFWEKYPRKTGKLAAQQAYEKARRLASEDEILAGVERYMRTKPDYADWCHPKTFLNQGRWMDEDDAPVTTWQKCDHEPTCNSPQWCQVLREREKAS